ncbi:MAG: PAS domain S-box protein [Syntrophales bacterium]|jgi:diguanylate cyclase (GGDEF)-like protein/PAS domain S-box-containing protein|nr:PAS domain S-box protein [Syntrophales bacterium]
MNKSRIVYSLPIILLLIVTVAGWFATDYLGNKARQEVIGESRASVLTVSTHVSSTFKNLEGAVKSLAGSPWIAPALMSKRDREIEHANSVLDRYNSALNASITFLMDAGGMTVASSNRNDQNSFVGKSLSFRPYFQEAAKGKPGRYFALGTIAKKRGFYASYPVQNRPGKVLGVVAMKKDLDEMETFFSKYPFCFLINPDGIIFLSSTPSMVLKSFWPLDKSVEQQLIASQQFGKKLFESGFFKKEVADGTEAALEGNDYFISRKVIDSAGWSIILLTPTDRIRKYKLIGILATIFLCSLIMVFSGIVYVTDRSKEALRQSEELYKALAEKSIAGVYVVQDGKFRFINSNAASYAGYTREELLAREAGLLISPEDREKVRQDARAMLRGEMSSPYEFRIITKQGEPRWIMETVASIVYEGRPAILGNSMNITKHKQAEEALQINRTQLADIIAFLPDATLAIDKERRIIIWNKAIEEMTGVPAAEMIGKGDYVYTIPFYGEARPQLMDLVFLDHKEIEARYPNIIREGNSLNAEAFCGALHNNEGAWVFAKASPLHDQSGKIIGAIESIRDITGHKRLEKALQKSEKEYRTLVDNASDIIFRTNATGLFTFVNPAALRITGYEEKEIIGKPYSTLIRPDMQEETIKFFSRQFVKKIKNTQLEYPILTKDGHEVWLEQSTQLISLDGHVVSFQAIARDIGDRKRMEAEILRLSITDQLTGLHNRRGFLSLAEQQLKLAERNKSGMLLFFADLDGLKWINDTLGHEEGDRALIEAATVFKETFRTSDIIARLGGDEYAALAVDITVASYEIFTARLQSLIDTRNNQENRRYRLSISVGFSYYDPENSCSIDELMASADKLMYEQKQIKKGLLVQGASLSSSNPYPSMHDEGKDK